MPLPDFIRTTTFRWTLAVAGVFVLYTLVLFGFVYWQTAAYLISGNDALLTEELRVFAANTPEQRLAEIDDRLRKDPRRIKIAGLFGADGHRIVGNIESLPGGLTPDIPAVAVVVRLDGGDRENQKVKLAAHPLPSGEILVIGRNIDEIAEIEHSRRLEGFSEVRLAALVREVGDLYDPIAEDKRVALGVEAADEAIVRGDRDLLFEAVANLVDNAVKFPPEGGRVDLALLRRDGETVIRVRDTGPGIPEIEREAVTKRFYRSDKSRRTEGLGLGLSLVAAIVKLHGFRFTIVAGPGCTAEIACKQEH